MAIEVPYIDNDWLLETFPDSSNPERLIKATYINQKELSKACLGYEVQREEIERLKAFLQEENVSQIYMSTTSHIVDKTFRIYTNTENFVDDFYKVYETLEIKWLGWLLFNEERDILMITDSDYYHAWVGSEKLLRAVLPASTPFEKVRTEFKDYIIHYNLKNNPFFNYILENYT